jgi:hypothetical protein
MFRLGTQGRQGLAGIAVNRILPGQQIVFKEYVIHAWHRRKHGMTGK